jgi:hypothetical protein
MLMKSANKSNLSNQNPITSSYPDEDEVKHDSFEFFNDDEIFFQDCCLIQQLLNKFKGLSMVIQIWTCHY